MGFISTKFPDEPCRRVLRVDLFVRETGPIGAPAVVFLHGGYASGWSWQRVVELLQDRYRCLVPDLPEYGKSADQRPFEMGQAAEAVAELIVSRAGTGRANVVGFSLGAQVAVQLLATQPDLVDRAVLCGTPINTMPGKRFTRFLVGRFARARWFRWAMKCHWNTRHARLPFPDSDEYRKDARLITGAQLANIVAASFGFALPDGIDKAYTSALFISGANELALTRRWAAKLSQLMRNGVDGVVLGVRHDWPLRYPDLFSRTVDGWLSQTALPPQVRLLNRGSR